MTAGPTAHSPFGASSAHRWTECPGSVRAQEGLSDKGSPEAQEGTALHAIAAHCLEQGMDAAELVDRVFAYEDHGELKNIEIDADQAECVQDYLDVVRGGLVEAGDEYELLVEQRFHLEHLHPLFFGTCDAAIVHRVTRYPLAVFDLKTGRGHVVDVRDARRNINKQLGYYGLGAIGNRSVNEPVDLCIVQPRAYHPDGPVRRTTALAGELHALAEELVLAAVNADFDGALRRSGSWCTFCKAAPTCAELREHAYDRADLVWQDDIPVVPSFELSASEPDVHKLAKVLAAADVIEVHIAAARALAHDLAERGYDIPGWKLVDRQARRKWKDDAFTAACLRFDFGLDHKSIFKETLLSPSQAEKKIPAKQKGLLASLWSKESSGRTLVREDNPRPPALPRSTAAFPEDENTEKLEKPRI
jgi:hypothetical protein